MRQHLPATLACLLLVTGGLIARAQDPSAQKPSFRTAVALVPVDVAVVSREGNAVLDLKKEDFTILEDGVVQEIVHFSLGRATASPGTQPLDILTITPRSVPVLDLAPQQRRVFLVALTQWRGVNIQEPTKGLDALLEFIHARLLPQDVIAVMAYNRATVFTSNHSAIASVVERYRDRSAKIGTMLEHYFSGLASAYSSGKVPDYIQKEIDGVFDVPGASMRGPAGVETMRTSQVAPPAGSAADVRPSQEGGGPGDSLADLNATAINFDNYVAHNLQTMQGLSQVFAGIEYMRHMEGQKRLLYMGPGLYLPRVDDDHAIASMANDARVAIDVIHTGGIEGPAMVKGQLSMVPEFGTIFNFMSMRAIADETGGQSFITSYSKPAFDRINAVTETQYLLGYYPSNTDWNGKYRHVEVKVNRPGVTVATRRGYYARQDLAPYDPREFLIRTRMATAAWSNVERADIKLKTDTRNDELKIVIDMSKIAFSSADNRHNAQLRIAIFYGDDKQTAIHEHWDIIDLKLKDDTYANMLKTGFTYRCLIPVSLNPKYMKIVVYNYESDLVGTAEKQLR